MQKTFRKHDKTFFDQDRKARASKIAYNMAKNRPIDEEPEPKGYELGEFEDWLEQEIELTDNSGDLNY